MNQIPNQQLSRSQRRVLQQLRNDAEAVLAHEPSMRFLCRMLAECRYHDDPFAGNSNTTFRNLGEQEAARKIVRALEAVDPNALIKLLTTAAKHRANSAQPNEEASDE